jgi:uncharacterized coiled-coil DUF342 family protein
MAKKDRLTGAAVAIGSTLGKADRAAHKVRKAVDAANEELVEIQAQFKALRRQLKKTGARLKDALK